MYFCPYNRASIINILNKLFCVNMVAIKDIKQNEYSGQTMTKHVFVSKRYKSVKQIALHCGWDLFYILGIKVSNMILSKKFNIQICNFFVLNHTLNHIIHLNFSKAELIQLRFLCSYWSVSDGKPEVCTEWDLVVLCQVEQLHRHLLLFVLNPHRLFICCVETAETINVYE